MRREYGVPSFAADITSAEARQIEAFILTRARDSASPAQRPLLSTH
jgi:hypothetical protein